MRFDELDLEDEILDGLDDMNFQEMTPVQEHTIPVILEGRDIIGCAQTGTGKTAAYTLPLLNRLLIEGNEDNVIKSVIIVPTRELAQQIDQQFQGFSYYLPVSTTVVYGGGDGKGWDVQKRGMLMGSDVVIATPGRMISHIQNSGIDLSHVECLILDEADRMLDMGFSEDIMKIVSYMPKDRQTIMFSATLPPKIREMARTILRNPAEVNIAISKPNEAIDQSAYVCYENQKLGIIREMFAEPTDSKTIIFSSSKLKVKELAHTLKRMKLNVAAMHSDLEQAQREEVMLDFKNNKVSILVATDIVARGIDIEDIGLVINYDVPHDPEDYIHRIGRTARAAATGSAVTFVSEDEQGKFHADREVHREGYPQGRIAGQRGRGPRYTILPSITAVGAVAVAEAVAAAVRTAEAVGADAQTRANAQGANAATTGNGVRRLPKIPGSQSLRRHLPITTTPPGAAKAIVGRVTANTAIAGAGTVAAAISLRAAKPRSRAVACPGSSPCGIHRERRHAGCRAEGFPNRQQP